MPITVKMKLDYSRDDIVYMSLFEMFSEFPFGNHTSPFIYSSAEKY